MDNKCKAAWDGGKCQEEDLAARGLCQGHYAQWRRADQAGHEPVYRPLRVASEGGSSLVPVTVHMPRGKAEKYRAAAKDAGRGISEHLRQLLEAGEAKLAESAKRPRKAASAA